MNLSAIRSGLLGFTAAMLALGYGASQWFFFQGKATEYARMVDVPQVRLLSLGLLGVFIVLSLIKEDVVDR